jgi:hypothetical protein
MANFMGVSHIPAGSAPVVAAAAPVPELLWEKFVANELKFGFFQSSSRGSYQRAVATSHSH